jgi:hypothetical protein
MMILLFCGERTPLEETIGGDLSAVGASSIISETFGKAAQPFMGIQMAESRASTI